MKRNIRPLPAAVLLTAMVLSACGGTAPTVTPPVNAASTQPVQGTGATGAVVTASAVVVPVQSSQMSFLISAPVKEIDVREGDQVKAGQTLIVLDTPDLEYDVTGAKAALQSAQVNAQLQRYPRKTITPDHKVVSLSSPPEVRAVADAKVDQAQAALDSAQATLAQGTLKAPYDGTIVKLNVTTGELVRPGEVVAVIGTLNRFQVETTDLSERDIAGVQIGQTVSAHIKALNQDLTGKVAAIAPMAAKDNGDWVYKVTIELDSPPSDLIWGMSVDVEIQTD